MIEYTTHSELVSEIVCQFAFMKLMSEETDNNYESIQHLSIDDVFKKADIYFKQHVSFDQIIDTDESDLESGIVDFLSEWKHITDVKAIFQNILFGLKSKDI